MALLLTTCCWLPAAEHLLLAGSLLLTGSCWLAGSCCLPAACCLLLGVCSWLPGVGWLLLKLLLAACQVHRGMERGCFRGRPECPAGHGPLNRILARSLEAKEGHVPRGFPSTGSWLGGRSESEEVGPEMADSWGTRHGSIRVRDELPLEETRAKASPKSDTWGQEKVNHGVKNASPK
jgi:hypothetical protein